VPKTAKAQIVRHSSSLTDPRRRKVMDPLLNIVTITLCAVICGADDFVSIALWAQTRKDWLAKFLGLRAGIPSHDWFNSVLARIKRCEQARFVCDGPGS